MSAGRDETTVAEAAVVLLAALSANQLKTARNGDQLGYMTNVPRWAVAGLERAVEELLPGAVARVRKAMQESPS